MFGLMELEQLCDLHRRKWDPFCCTVESSAITGVRFESQTKDEQWKPKLLVPDLILA